MTKTCKKCNLSYDTTDKYARCPVCEPRKRYVCPECGEKYNSEDCPVCYGGFFNKVFENKVFEFIGNLFDKFIELIMFDDVNKEINLFQRIYNVIVTVSYQLITIILFFLIIISIIGALLTLIINVLNI